MNCLSEVSTRCSSSPGAQAGKIKNNVASTVTIRDFNKILPNSQLFTSDAVHACRGLIG